MSPSDAQSEARADIALGPPGIRSFTQRHELNIDRRRAFRQALDDIVPAMERYGFDVTERVEDQVLAFAFPGQRPGWWGAVNALLSDRNPDADNEHVVVVFTDVDGGASSVLVTGMARRPVRKAFANLAAD